MAAAFSELDPVVSGLDEEILVAQREVNRMLGQTPQPDFATEDGLALLRRIVSPPQPAPVLVPENVTIAGPGGDLRVRVFTPDGPVRAVMLRIHGGGWAAGAPEDDEALNDQLARTNNIVVVSPDYRLVPEVAIPDQIEDCLVAARWTADAFATERLLLGGTSAGAHLAATVLLRLRDLAEPAFARFAGVHLDCGGYDMSRTPSVLAADESTPVLSSKLLDGLMALGLPGLDFENRRDADLSPLYADLHGLPPALFTVGAVDPLRDDSAFMAVRWRMAGNKAALDVWPEGAHAFTNMGTPLSAVAFERTSNWIDSVLTNESNPAVGRRF